MNNRTGLDGVYDLTLHGAGPAADPDQLWFSLLPTLTPLPPPAGTSPVASFAPIMGGYDAGYYGYLWSKVYAEDLFTGNRGATFGQMMHQATKTADAAGFVRRGRGRHRLACSLFRWFCLGLQPAREPSRA